MDSGFYMAGMHTALMKLGIESGFGNDGRMGLSVGDASGHQEALEENDPRPKRMHPSTLANAPRTTSGPSETISRAFDAHDAIKPRDISNLPRTEYVG